MTRADYIVVGSGLTGATVARALADAGREVIVLERRAHVGGNVHDSLHKSGVRVHTYGPHYFRTGSQRLWEYVQRFGAFYAFEARVVTLVDDQYESWPVSAAYLSRALGGECVPTFAGTPRNFEEACLAMMPSVLFDKFVRGYTEKQWGVPAAYLSPELATRVRVRTNTDTRLVSHAYQGLPVGGYHLWMQNMLKDIPVMCGVDYLTERADWQHRTELIFTGSLDEFFGFSLGRLQYRGQNRCHMYYPDHEHVLPCAQVNNPDPAHGSHVRLLEWKYMMEQAETAHLCGTVVTAETPYTPTDPDAYEYPFPDAINRARHAEYVRMATTLTDTVFCGRLGEYRYYDMDQAIGRAALIARRIIGGARSCALLCEAGGQ